MNATGQRQVGRGEERLSHLMRCFAVPARGPLETQLEHLKQRLLQPILEKISDSGLAKELSWAATEAAALAWYTGFPILIFPALLEEKLQAAWKRWERQQEIWSLAA